MNNEGEGGNKSSIDLEGGDRKGGRVRRIKARIKKTAAEFIWLPSSALLNGELKKKSLAERDPDCERILNS